MSRLSNLNTPLPAPEQRTSSQAKWDAANPKAKWAHASVRSAIRRKLIERQPCEVCGEPETDGHHDDYDRPLAVRWLCRLHHRHHHAAERLNISDEERQAS